MTIPNLNLLAIGPEIILVSAALIVLLVDAFARQARPALGWVSLVAVVAAAGAAIAGLGGAPVPFQAMALADGLAAFLGVAILIAAALALLLSIARAADFTNWLGAYYALLLLATAGMRTMVVASDFMTIFLALEILSLALYVLVGFNRKEARSSEASLKYFLLGAFASGFLLYGMALIYGATGTTQLAQLANGTAQSVLPGVPLLEIGVGLLLVGFGFKLALVPFHQWTPDVYQGAPTAVTAFMSVSTKAAAFGALIRVLASLGGFNQTWLIALAVIAALTMTLGNVAALRQTSLKRLLAYSSIAHAGYVLTGLVANSEYSVQGALYYLLAYTFMNLGAFAVVLAVQRVEENDVTVDRLAGLAGRQPALAALMAVFLFSLTGIPPLAGFFGKLYVFGAAVQAGYAWLAALGMLNSAIAAYYYLRITVAMFMSEPAAGTAPVAKPAAPVWAAIVLSAVATVVLGIWQFPWMQSIGNAVAQLAMR